jgi:hypothetical protein
LAVLAFLLLIDRAVRPLAFRELVPFDSVVSAGAVAMIAFFTAARLLIKDFFGTDMVPSSRRVSALETFLNF